MTLSDRITAVGNVTPKERPFCIGTCSLTKGAGLLFFRKGDAAGWAHSDNQETFFHHAGFAVRWVDLADPSDTKIQELLESCDQAPV